MLSFASHGFHFIPKLREDRDRNRTNATRRPRDNDGSATRFDPARNDRGNTLRGSKSGGAINHGLTKRQPTRKRYDPFRRHTHKLSISTPVARPQVIAGHEDLVT